VSQSCSHHRKLADRPDSLRTPDGAAGRITPAGRVLQFCCGVAFRPRPHPRPRTACLTCFGPQVFVREPETLCASRSARATSPDSLPVTRKPLDPAPSFSAVVPPLALFRLAADALRLAMRPELDGALSPLLPSSYLGVLLAGRRSRLTRLCSLSAPGATGRSKATSGAAEWPRPRPAQSPGRYLPATAARIVPAARFARFRAGQRPRAVKEAGLARPSDDHGASTGRSEGALASRAAPQRHRSPAPRIRWSRPPSSSAPGLGRQPADRATSERPCPLAATASPRRRHERKDAKVSQPGAADLAGIRRRRAAAPAPPPEIRGADRSLSDFQKSKAPNQPPGDGF